MPALSLATPLPVRFTLRSPRATLARLTTLHFGAASFVVLIAGLSASILTTTDPLWWQLHFSQLGTFRDTSGAFFNGTLMAGGAVVTLFAWSVRRDLLLLRRVYVRRGAPLVAQICLSVVGVNLALVGCIPLNVNKLLHDNVAASMVLGFAALLLSSPILLHRMPRRLLVTTIVTFIVIFALAWLFVTETINLALFELLATAAMFTWSAVFTRSIASRVKLVTASADAPAGTPAATSPSRRHRVLRSRRRALATPARRSVPSSMRRRSSAPSRSDRSSVGRPHQARRPLPARGAPHVAQRVARAPLPRARTGSAARAASARSTTPDRR